MDSGRYIAINLYSAGLLEIFNTHILKTTLQVAMIWLHAVTQPMVPPQSVPGSRAAAMPVSLFRGLFWLDPRIIYFNFAETFGPRRTPAIF